MSPAMLTLVAAVLVYDMALEMCDTRSSAVARDETDDSPRGRGRRPLTVEEEAVVLVLLDSRRARSWTRLEKDIVVVL